MSLTEEQKSALRLADTLKKALCDCYEIRANLYPGEKFTCSKCGTHWSAPKFY
jgi:hypothetical protein